MASVARVLWLVTHFVLLIVGALLVLLGGSLLLDFFQGLRPQPVYGFWEFDSYSLAFGAAYLAAGSWCVIGSVRYLRSRLLQPKTETR
jgi:hypothetical protein